MTSEHKILSLVGEVGIDDTTGQTVLSHPLCKQYNDSNDDIQSTTFAKAYNVSRRSSNLQVSVVTASDIRIYIKDIGPRIRGLLKEKFTVNSVRIPERRKWPVAKPAERVEAEKLEHAMITLIPPN